jgi:predicted outer membrane repeat protein
VLTKCLFNENGASSGGAISGDDGSRLLADRCIFVRNNAERAGAIYGRTLDARFTFTNCVFSGNTGLGYGGAARVSNTAFTNCVFTGNRAHGYALYGGTWLPSAGGAVCDIGLNAFTNCTFDNNWAECGCTLYTSFPMPSSIKNCIFRGSEDQIRDEADAGLRVQYSNIQGDWLGAGNIDLDPAFADPGYWADPNDPNRPGDPNDPNTIWVDGDYHLKSQAGRWDPTTDSWVIDDVTSPCIDAGDPNSPVGDEPQPNGGRINMGTYGGTREASMSLHAGLAGLGV